MNQISNNLSLDAMIDPDSISIAPSQASSCERQAAEFVRGRFDARYSCMNLRSWFACLSVGMLMLGTASASMLSLEHPAFGPGSMTLSTTQGLRWLDPSITAGLSFRSVQVLLSSDSRFAGFRVATISELEGLFSAAAIHDVNVAGYGALYGTESNVAGVMHLQNFTGTTYQITSGGVGLAETAGYVGSAYMNPINGFISVQIGSVAVRTNVQTQFGVSSFASAYSNWGSLLVGSETAGVGTWLVSEVPEPSSMALLLAGLSIVALRRSPNSPAKQAADC